MMLMPVTGAGKQICTMRLSFPDVAGPTRPGRAMLRAMKLIIRWLLLAAALLLVAHLYRGVTVASFGSALIAAFVIGLFNTLVRPVLVL